VHIITAVLFIYIGIAVTLGGAYAVCAPNKHYEQIQISQVGSSSIYNRSAAAMLFQVAFQQNCLEVGSAGPTPQPRFLKFQ
jgi:hypothetical protein